MESETVGWSPESVYDGTPERQFVNVLHSQFIPPAPARGLSRAV